MLSTPVFGVFLTLLAYAAGIFVYRLSHSKPWANPVLIGVSLILMLLIGFGIAFEDYWRGGQILSFFMGPIVVAMAIPLFDNLARIRKQALPILASLAVGSFVTVGSAWLLAKLMGLSSATQLTMTTKSVTSAIGMEIANSIGGIPPLSALIIMFTGVLGGVIGPCLLTLARIHNPAARGMAYGLCAHAVGTLQAFEESAETGALAALSMSLMGVLCALLIPLLLG
jgi:predicted murein hydrolase (TIGR00659 family)